MVVLSFCMFAAGAQPKEFNSDESTIAPYVLPDPLLTQTGRRVSNKRQGARVRRPELYSLFEGEMFGVKIDFRFSVFGAE